MGSTKLLIVKGVFLIFNEFLENWRQFVLESSLGVDLNLLLASTEKLLPLVFDLVGVKLVINLFLGYTGKIPD